MWAGNWKAVEGGRKYVPRRPGKQTTPNFRVTAFVLESAREVRTAYLRLSALDGHTAAAAGMSPMPMAHHGKEEQGDHRLMDRPRQGPSLHALSFVPSPWPCFRFYRNCTPYGVRLREGVTCLRSSPAGNKHNRREPAGIDARPSPHPRPAP